MARRPTASAAPQAPAVHTPSRSAKYVTIACKLAVARFELQLCRQAIVKENTQTGPREVKTYFKTGQVYVVRGTAYPEGTPPKRFIKRPAEVEGYALTENVVPAAFWEEWLTQYGQTDMVKNRLIFAADTYDEIEGMAGENEDVKCSFAPLDMPDREGDPVDARVPRSIHEGVGDVEKITA